MCCFWGVKSCRQGRIKRDVGASSFCFGWLKAVDKVAQKGMWELLANGCCFGLKAVDKADKKGTGGF